jgi:phasin
MAASGPARRHARRLIRLAKERKIAPCARAGFTGCRADSVNRRARHIWYGSLGVLEEATMAESKLEVPAELRDLAEKTIDQAEKAFGLFFDAASKSMTSIPGGNTEISKQALTFTEQNMKAAFDHARKLVHATDLQEAMRLQSEFLRSQFTNAGEHMREISGKIMSAGKGKP